MKEEILNRLLQQGHITESEYNILLDIEEDKSIWKIWTEHILTNLK